jgi:hypothetical protein
MLAANSDRFDDRKAFFKFLFIQIFVITLVFTVIYEVVAYFVNFDDYLLVLIFDLDGSLLARSIMMILPSFPFQVIFYIISGYKQGKRQYFAISLASVFSFGISFIPGYFLTKYIGLDGALISMIIFSVILAASVFGMTYPKQFEFKLEAFTKKIIKKFRKEQPVSIEGEKAKKRKEDFQID